MAPTKSNRTIRLRGIARDIPIDRFKAAIELTRSAASRRVRRKPFASSAVSNLDRLTYSFVEQNGFVTSTVSFASADAKAKAIKTLADDHANWEVDDHFTGLTILSAPEHIDTDICTVHGLGGNAFDTWMGSSKMWPRDFLPNSTPLERSRIMTFGYDSSPINRKSNDRMRDWADELLRQVGYLRTSPEEHARPIIFICHSLGGLVGREAMWRLSTQAAKFDGIQLNKCGLIFLSTPHSGTTQADWNNFLVDLSEHAFGVRSHDIVDELRSFNYSSVDSAENFASMVPKPPFHCFCEGERMSVAGRNRIIVTQASAGFCGQVAEKILKVDHRSICKFDTQFGAYMQILAQLKRIRALLLNHGGGELECRDETQNVPGRPNIVAPHYPLNERAKWYEGASLRTTSQLVGRADKLDEIIKSLEVQDIYHPKLIALTGIGGIGRRSVTRPLADWNRRKTEILLEVAFLHGNVSNVFFIQARDLETLESAFLEIAISIGHDLLSIRFPHTDLVGIWRSYGPSERVRAFKTWLGHRSNQASLFIVDDLDGFKDETLIKAALPREAQYILYSTRDPSLIGSLERDSQTCYVPTMRDDEIASLMTTTMRRSGVHLSGSTISEDELEAIAKVVDGHALGACRAISYILHVLAQTADESPARLFLDMFKGSDWESRLNFLEYKPRIGFSIMETFATSLERLHRHQKEARRFLEFLAFLSDKGHTLNFRRFLRIERPWLQELRCILPDYDVFASGLAGQREYLADLESVSIGIRPDVSSPLQIHPLWLECIQQRAGHEGRVRWIRQIIMICHGSYARGEKQNFLSLRPFLQNSFTIAARFDIRFEELLESQELRNWFNPFQEDFEDSLSENRRSSESGDGMEVANTVADEVSEAAPSTLREMPELFQHMVDLQGSCNEAAQALTSLNTSKMSEEGFTSWLQRYLALLRRLRSLEENEQDVRKIETLHLEIYDILLRMAPKFEHLNPRLGDQLRGRKDEIQRAKSIAKQDPKDCDRY